MLYPVPNQCPICGGEVTITKLECMHCDVKLEGRFAQSQLAGLNQEQLRFVETFIRCEGTIKRVEKELGISYPTVRARLKEVIEAMGFQVLSELEEVTSLSEEERREILEQLERGAISYEEAMNMLNNN